MATTELEFNKEQHISYVLGSSFDQKMNDIYIGLMTWYRPPFIEEIMSESMQIQALLIMEHEKMEGYPNVPEHMWEEWDELIWQNNDYAISSLFESTSEGILIEVLRNIYNYLVEHDITFASVRDKGIPIRSMHVYQSPVSSVW